MTYYQNRQSVSLEDVLAHDIVLTTYPILEYEYRTIVDRQKVTCQYCAKKFLPRSLVSHQKYFCGPVARRTEKLSKTERKKQGALAKGMKTLGIKAGPEHEMALAESKKGKGKARRKKTKRAKGSNDG